MYKNKTVSAVVPAYNEAGYVGRVIDTLPSYIDRAYIVDDGSTDDTWEEILAHTKEFNETHDSEAEQFDRIVVPIQHVENRGVGGAIKTGYLAARDDEIAVTVVLGGDAQMNPDVIPKYLDPIVEGDADYAKGNRFMEQEDYEAMPTFRFVGNVMLSYLTKFASGYWKSMDSQNGYTAISLEALETADIENMYEYYGYCNDLLVKLNAENLRVADVRRNSTFAYEDIDWKSHIEYDEYIPRVSKMLLKNFVWRQKHKYLLRDSHPLALCYGLGGALSGAGLLGGVNELRAKRSDVDGGSAAWLVTLLFGVAFLFAGMVLDSRDNASLESQVREDDYDRADEFQMETPADDEADDENVPPVVVADPEDVAAVDVDTDTTPDATGAEV